MTLFDLSPMGGSVVESSRSASLFKCPICLEENIQVVHGVVLGECGDLLCKTCSTTYLKTKCAQRETLPLPCPTCRKPLDNARCVSALQGEIFQASFAQLVAEHAYERKRYCSNPRCAVPFDWIDDPRRRGAPDEFRVHCPLCKTDTCARCRGPWHAGQECHEVIENGADMRAVGELARRNNWTPCPSCHALIEKNADGCNHVRCRCGTSFCHRCGAKYEHNRPTALNSHGQPSCSCGLFQREPREDRIRLLSNAIAAANRVHFNQPLPLVPLVDTEIIINKLSLDIVVGKGAPEVKGDIICVENAAKEDVAFKMKTTNRERYIVRPNVGCIPSGETLEIRIDLAQDAAEPAPGPSLDRFQLRLVAVPGLSKKIGSFDFGQFDKFHPGIVRIKLFVNFVRYHSSQADTKVELDGSVPSEAQEEARKMAQLRERLRNQEEEMFRIRIQMALLTEERRRAGHRVGKNYRLRKTGLKFSIIALIVVVVFFFISLV